MGVKHYIEINSIIIHQYSENGMNYRLVKDIIDIAEAFEKENAQRNQYTNDANGFKKWMLERHSKDCPIDEPQWEGKEKGRSAESVISTFIVHMNRYAKNYAKSAIHGSDFSTQEDFIYLINLKAFGEMTKMALIRKNIHDKPAGMQIINRLIRQGWVEQRYSITDRRSRVISISPSGLKALENQMAKIRKATTIVTGDLTYTEKMQLIYLLDKLNDFHYPLYKQNLDGGKLLEEASRMQQFDK